MPTHPSTLQPNGRSRLGRVLFPALVQVSPLLETCSGLVGGFFLPLGCRKVGSTFLQAKVQGTWRGIHIPRDLNNPRLRALQSNTNLLSSLPGDISGPASGGAPGLPQCPGPPPLSAMLCWATLR